MIEIDFRRRRRSERQPPTPSPRPSSAADPRGTGPMTDAEAIRQMNRLQVGDRRSTFAQALFPYDPTKYRSRGEWQKTVGKKVASDIHRNLDLRLAMEKAGYEPNRQGYTLEQRIILVKFYGASSKNFGELSLRSGS